MIGRFSTRRRLIRSIDHARIETAIAAAEAETSGEIRVSIAPFFWGSVRATAERAFGRLGMAQTRLRNGVLLFIVPARRKFVVLGDEGIHARVGDPFWSDVVDGISKAFKTGRYEDGLVKAIERVGAVLRSHFPAESQPEGLEPNELSNSVDFDQGAD